MTEKSRILIFSSSYVPIVGGLQSVAHNLAKQLLTRGHDVRVVTNRYPIALPPREVIDRVMVDRVLLLPASIDYLKRRRLDLFLASLYYGPKSHWRLANIFSEFRPDVVNVHFPDGQVDAVLKLRKRFGFRLVVSLHGDDVERFTNDASENGSQGSLSRFKAILRAADAVTAVSRDLLDKAIRIERAIAGKSHVIHNGIDFKRFAERACHDHPRSYLLAAGRLVYKKGFDLLIDAYARCQSNNRSDLIIAGGGEEREALERQVERLGLRDKIYFFGQASSDEVVKLMNGSLGVVVPSRQEPFGIVALEALAAGRPVLATKTGGLQEVLTDLSNDCRSNGPASGHGDRRVMLVEPTTEGIRSGLLEMFKGRPCPRETGGIPKKYAWPQVARRYEELLLRPR